MIMSDQNSMKFQSLTSEEKAVIVDKWTEAPNSGEYNHHSQEWTYLCRQCLAPLYRSTDKFDSRCGWPAFDDAIPGAIHRSTDADGHRTEITCARCHWHLGHVFIGEQMTQKNTRHCVNSLSMKFVPECVEHGYEIAYLAGWCFWCLEAVYQRLEWVVDVKSGYAWGKRPHPSYEQVSTWATWHQELVRVVFDSEKINYEVLLDVFFTMHDPTSYDRQWNDVGSQYRSVIFTVDEKQQQLAEHKIQQLADEKLFDEPIVTEVKQLETFWMAEGHHQDYFNQYANQSYCQFVISPKIAKLKHSRQHLLHEQS